MMKKRNKGVIMSDYEWPKLGYYLGQLSRSDLTKRELNLIAKEFTKFACSSDANKILKNLVARMSNSEYAKFFLGYWQANSQKKRGDWRIRQGSQILLSKIKNPD